MLLTIIGIVVVVLLVLVGGGLLGWLITLIGKIFEFLFDGLASGLGCLWRIILFIILAAIVISMCS